MASRLPVPCPDEAEAGSVWRSDKLRDFAWRLKCLGLEGDAAALGLLKEISAQSQALEELRAQQEAPGYERPWWQTGEYDDARADEANDRGMALYRARAAGPAFDAFTEAVRLRPASAVHLANRAAAALALGKPDVAAADAAEAVKRDPGYVKAHLRAGRAALALRDAPRAAAAFAAALGLQPGLAAAARGAEHAAAMQAQQEAAQAAEAAAAAAGARPGLPQSAPDEAAAAQALLSAEAMLAANPRSEAATAAYAEALLLCARYGDAGAALARLAEGSADQAYLAAELAWRQGRLGEAEAELAQALAAAPACDKASTLLRYVRRLAGLEAVAAEAAEAGPPRAAAEAAAALLAALPDPPAASCTGLYCATLCRRAEALAARGMLPNALADLDAALAADASHLAALRLRVELRREAGLYVDSFLDLQLLAKLEPGAPGLLGLLRRAAELCARAPRGAGGAGAGAGAGSGRAVSGGAAAALGLQPGSASQADVRRAYLSLAARWHPDKWASAPPEERQEAEERFKEVQAAYEALAGT